MAEEIKETPKEEIKHTDFFPGGTDKGKLFNINGMIWLMRPSVIVYDEDSIEWGWHGNNLGNNAEYHFFTESEIEANHLVIQEF